MDQIMLVPLSLKLGPAMWKMPSESTAKALSGSLCVRLVSSVTKSTITTFGRSSFSTTAVRHLGCSKSTWRVQVSSHHPFSGDQQQFFFLGRIRRSSDLPCSCQQSRSLRYFGLILIGQGERISPPFSSSISAGLWRRNSNRQAKI